MNSWIAALCQVSLLFAMPVMQNGNFVTIKCGGTELELLMKIFYMTSNALKARLALKKKSGNKQLSISQLKKILSFARMADILGVTLP